MPMDGDVGVLLMVRVTGVSNPDWGRLGVTAPRELRFEMGTDSAGSG